MSDTEAMPGEKLLFLFGDGGGPENFAHNCSIITNRKVDFTALIAESKKYDCADPSKPTVPNRRVTGMDIAFGGDGIADVVSHKALLAQHLKPLISGGDGKFNGKVIQDLDGAAGWTILAEWVIETCGLGGEHGTDQNFDVSIKLAGRPTLTGFS